MQIIISRVPFFALPWINPIVVFCVRKVITILAVEADTRAFFVYVDLRTSVQGKRFHEAAMVYERVKKEGTQQEKDDAQKILITEFDIFAKFTSH